VSDTIEKAAEIFAAELVYPDDAFIADLEHRGIARGACDAAAIVRLKHETKTTLSYASLSKRATFFGFAPPASLDRISWHKLEEAMYGEPLYKRILRRRRSA